VKLEVRPERERYAPGETVAGAVVVAEGGSSRRLEIELRYREQTMLEEYEHTALTVPGGELHTGDLEAGASFAFAIPLPADALPSFKSAHGELFWELDARSDERGVDTHERVRVVVASPSSATATA
jgi:hypothetical protein